jgi:plastocyanin
MLALLLLSGCGSDNKGDSSSSAVKPPILSGDITLNVDESTSSFDKSTAKAKPGTIKITVVNPADAKGQHGVGIDGGAYKDVKGAAVKPGRSTSLTVAVKEGNYTIFDSYKNNRNKGYETKLTVAK